jgi:hypothetical protein
MQLSIEIKTKNAKASALGCDNGRTPKQHPTIPFKIVNLPQTNGQ